MKNNPKKSIYFVTFHRTASSFFSNTVLKNFTGLTHVDYASSIFQNKLSDKILFHDYGYIYGPVRLTLEEGAVYELFVKKILSDKLLEQGKLLILVRDPREILISYYYSQAVSHALSNDKSIAKIQLKNRIALEKVTLDEYALKNRFWLKSKFDLLRNIMELNDNVILLKYEDMIDNYESFFNKLNEFSEMAPQMESIIFQATRPNLNEDEKQHKRSGKTRTYEEKLKQKTIQKLNRVFEPVFEYYGYYV